MRLLENVFDEIPISSNMPRVFKGYQSLHLEKIKDIIGGYFDVNYLRVNFVRITVFDNF